MAGVTTVIEETSPEDLPSQFCFALTAKVVSKQPDPGGGDILKK